MEDALTVTRVDDFKEGEMVVPLYDVDFHIATVDSGAVSIWERTEYVPHDAWENTLDRRAMDGRIYKLVIRLNWRQIDELHHKLENWINLNTPAYHGEFLARMARQKKSAY